MNQALLKKKKQENKTKRAAIDEDDGPLGLLLLVHHRAPEPFILWGFYFCFVLFSLAAQQTVDSSAGSKSTQFGSPTLPHSTPSMMLCSWRHSNSSSRKPNPEHQAVAWLSVPKLRMMMIMMDDDDYCYYNYKETNTPPILCSSFDEAWCLLFWP